MVFGSRGIGRRCGWFPSLCQPASHTSLGSLLASQSRNSERMLGLAAGCLCRVSFGERRSQGVLLCGYVSDDAMDCLRIEMAGCRSGIYQRHIRIIDLEPSALCRPEARMNWSDQGCRATDMVRVRAPGRRVRRIHRSGIGNPHSQRILHVQVSGKIRRFPES